MIRGTYKTAAALCLYSFAYYKTEKMNAGKKEKTEDVNEEDDLMDEEKDNDLMEDEEEIVEEDNEKPATKQQTKFWQTSNYGFINPRV